MKKRAGLKTVISRQEHLQTLANRYIEAKVLNKSKGIYEVDNEPESAFNLLFNLDKIAGRTVQYSSIKALKMGEGCIHLSQNAISSDQPRRKRSWVTLES